MYETGSESSQYQVVTLLQLWFILPKGQRNGCRTGISEMLDIEHHLLHGQLQALGNGLDNTDIGLMGDDITDIVFRQTVMLCYQGTIIAHIGHGGTPYGPPDRGSADDGLP